MRRLQLPGSLPIHRAIRQCCCWSALALPVWGQTGSLGTVTGVVTDPSNAVVPDATVTIKDKATSTVTNHNNQQCGTLHVSSTCGPATTKSPSPRQASPRSRFPSDIVEVGTTSTNNVTLKVGSESQTIEVQSYWRGIADPERHRRQHGEWTCARFAPHALPATPARS